MKNSLFLILVIMFVFIKPHAFEYKYNPLKAAALSAVIPGGGQFYNDKKIKAAIVSVVEIGLIYKLYYDNSQKNYYYEKFKESNSQIEYQRFSNYYYKKQSDIFWLGFYVLLSSTDAFVDAHLYNFESQKKKIHILFKKNKLEVRYEF